jgi:hypothetical protein
MNVGRAIFRLLKQRDRVRSLQAPGLEGSEDVSGGGSEEAVDEAARGIICGGSARGSLGRSSGRRMSS